MRMWGVAVSALMLLMSATAWAQGAPSSKAQQAISDWNALSAEQETMRATMQHFQEEFGEVLKELNAAKAPPTPPIKATPTPNHPK